MWNLVMEIILSIIGLILTGVTIFGEYQASKRNIKQVEFENDRAPLNYAFSIGQPRLEKIIIPDSIIDMPLKPELIINLERKEGGKAKQVFLAEYRENLRIVSIEDKQSYKYNYDHAYFKGDSTSNKMSISFSPTDLLLKNIDNLALAKFIVIQGLDNHFQVITFIKFIGEVRHGTEDALIYFDGLEVYSESSWDTKITNHGWNEKTQKKLFSIYEKTYQRYSELCDFIQRNVVS